MIYGELIADIVTNTGSHGSGKHGGYHQNMSDFKLPREIQNSHIARIYRLRLTNVYV